MPSMAWPLGLRHRQPGLHRQWGPARGSRCRGHGCRTHQGCIHGHAWRKTPTWRSRGFGSRGGGACMSAHRQTHHTLTHTQIHTHRDTQRHTLHSAHTTHMDKLNQHSQAHAHSLHKSHTHATHTTHRTPPTHTTLTRSGEGCARKSTGGHMDDSHERASCCHGVYGCLCRGRGLPESGLGRQAGAQCLVETRRTRVARGDRSGRAWPLD